MLIEPSWNFWGKIVYNRYLAYTYEHQNKSRPMNQPDEMALLFVVMSLFILMAVFFYKIMRQTEQINESLKDIAKSQRILANNPKDFEETKKVNALKNKSPLEWLFRQNG